MNRYLYRKHKGNFKVSQSATYLMTFAKPSTAHLAVLKDHLLAGCGLVGTGAEVSAIGGVVRA